MSSTGQSQFGLDGDDTALARALHAGGVSLDALQRALAEVRARRAGDALTLATSLLASGAVTSAQLEAARNHLAQTAAPASAGAPAALPATFGPYRVVRELGRGGMGVVLEVVDPTGRRGALKTLVAGADAELVARFRREATLQARLDHPHVAPVHAAALETDGPPYLVQAFLTGGTLGERLAQGGPLAPADLATLGRKLAAGLQHAHDRGVLHRDLKPANILFDERGEPRIIDFGLARALDGASVRLTRTGELLGTPSFIAPEVLTGAPVDVRTDVHGLAGLLFAALTGRPPHEGAGLFATLNAALLHEPPRASTVRSPGLPAVPAWLDEALARGLSRSPDERPPTVAALGALLAGDPSAAAPAPGRRRALVGVAGLTGAALLAGLLGGRGGEAPPGPATSTTEPGGAARRARVAELIEGRAPLPPTTAERAALADELRSSGVADLGTASATLVDFLAEQRPAPAEVRRAVARLARDGPTPLTRAAAAPLWSGAAAARRSGNVGGERALAAAAALGGPEGEARLAVAAYFRALVEAELPPTDLDPGPFVREASEVDGVARDRLLRAAELVELLWRADPDTLPLQGDRLRGLLERLAQVTRRHYRSRSAPVWPVPLVEFGRALRAAAPSDPLFSAMGSLGEEPEAGLAQVRDALRRLERVAPPGKEVDFVFGTMQSALLAILVGRVIETGRWEELEGWLRTMLRESRCGPSVYEAFGRTLLMLCRRDPSRVERTRAELDALQQTVPEAGVLSETLRELSR